MATITTEKPVNEADIEVFTRTPGQIAGETCAKCGPAVAARYSATKDESDLYFCAHHIREYNDKLKIQGFTIFPEDISFTAGVVKK
jgi:hypothetical protein